MVLEGGFKATVEAVRKHGQAQDLYLSECYWAAEARAAPAKAAASLGLAGEEGMPGILWLRDDNGGALFVSCSPWSERGPVSR